MTDPCFKIFIVLVEKREEHHIFEWITSITNNIKVAKPLLWFLT